MCIVQFIYLVDKYKQIQPNRNQDYFISIHQLQVTGERASERERELLRACTLFNSHYMLHSQTIYLNIVLVHKTLYIIQYTCISRLILQFANLFIFLFTADLLTKSKYIKNSNSIPHRMRARVRECGMGREREKISYECKSK